MVMINRAGDGGRTPSYHSMESPRYGGSCVTSFLHLFDWNPSKRFSTTKRLPAKKPEKVMQRSRSVRSEHDAAANTRMSQICDAQFESEGSTLSAEDHAAELPHSRDASTRAAPSVVARLMGLESLPETTQPYQPPPPHRRWSYTGRGNQFLYEVESDGTPMLLQELLNRDFKSGRKTLRDRLPGFAKKAQAQYENRFTKKGAAEAVRCRQEEADMPAYIDIPDAQSENAKPSFLSRLAPAASSQRTSPFLPSKMHTPCEISPLMGSLEDVKSINPELSVRQPAGWPLAVQHICDRDHEVNSFRSVSDRSSELGDGRWAWPNGSEGSVSTNDLRPRGVASSVQKFPARESSSVKKASSEKRSLRKSVISDDASVRESKPLRLRSPVVSPKVATPPRRGTSSTSKAILPSKVSRESLIQSRKRSSDRSKSPVAAQESFRTSPASLESTSTSSNLTSNTISKSSAKAAKTGRPSPTLTRTMQTKVKGDAMSVKGTSKAPLHGKPPPLDGYRAPKVRNTKLHSTHVVSGSRVFPSAGSPSRVAESGTSLCLKEGDKLPVVSKKNLVVQETKNMRQSSLTLRKQSATNTLQGIQRVREKVLPSTTPVDRLKAENLEDMAVQNSCGKTTKHARARSVDEIFPELSFDFDNANAFTSSISESDIAMSHEQEVSVSLSRSIERMFGQGFARGDEFTGCEGDVRRGIDWCGSPVVGCGEANPLVDDLRWVDELLEQRVSYCERSCSGPSISSVSVAASDVDDERNGDAWSSCASYNPADCDSPRTFEIPDTDADSDLPEQKLAPPTFVKRISEESDGANTATEVDEAGQPSPVSILYSPFHDEACTTSESSLTDSHRQQNLDEDGVKSCNTNDRIRQALLDISMFQSLEVFTFKYNERITPTAGPKEEQSFVREILSAAQFLSTPGSSPNWFNRDVAIDPSLFDRLELSSDMDHIENGPAGGVQKLFQVSGGLWRCDRKLLFDCVNEAFALVLWRYRVPEMGLLQRISPRPRGQKLVEEVYKEIEEWRKLASQGTDSLVEGDMCVSTGSWKNFSVEVATVVLDIESMLWKAIVEEAVVDILSTLKRR